MSEQPQSASFRTVIAGEDGWETSCASIEGHETPDVASGRARSGLLRLVGRQLLAVLTAQYTLVTIGTSLAVAGSLRYLVTPHIVSQFEALAAALRH
jgi:hypothetical protein